MSDPDLLKRGSSVMKENTISCSQIPVSGLLTNVKNMNSKNCERESSAEGHATKSVPKSIATLKSPFFNDSLDEDFQTSHSKNKANCKIAKVKKKQEEDSFLCAVCNKDLTGANIDERTTHVNQCIDNQKSFDDAFGTSSSQSSSVFILDCPLCFKSFSSPELRSAHIKKCGKSRGLSIQSIIQAMQLQEKHVLERRAMGLPLHRTNQSRQLKNSQGPSKKSQRRLPVAPKSSLQSDLQLAKALSLSLKENESQSQKNFIQEVYPLLQPPSESQSPGRANRKHLNQLYPLLLRTEEEREKIIQDKINALVINMDNSNQRDSESPNQDSKNKEVSFLWNLSGKVEDKSSYYVEQLLNWVMPSDVETGSKLCNLSQIPGHRIFTQLPCDYTFSSDKTVVEEDKMCANSQLPSLLNSLQSLIGNSWLSDVDIHTASGIVIPAHKLILALRCSTLKDAFNDPPISEKHILNWQDTSFDAALHFLNFLYTGTTEWKDDIFDELFQLAKRYEVKDLIFILNNNCEASEFIDAEDSVPNISNASNIDDVSVDDDNKKESTEQESILKESNLNHYDSNSENKENCLEKEICSSIGTEIPENSVFEKSIKSTEVICDGSDNPVSSKKYTCEQDLFESKDRDCESPSEQTQDDYIPVIGSCNSVDEGKEIDLDATLPLNVQSESSNDSCKILDVGIKASQVPKKNMRIEVVLSKPNDNKIFPGNSTPTKEKQSISIRNLSTPEKLNNLSEPLAFDNFDDLNEDVIVLGGFRKSNDSTTPVVQNRLSSSKDKSSSRMSYDFLNSPFLIDDDINLDFYPNQDPCRQLDDSKDQGSRSNFLAAEDKSMYQFSNRILNEPNQTQKCEAFVESINRKNSFQSFDSLLEQSANRGSQRDVFSPEIFVCDSDGESDVAMNQSNFHTFREPAENQLNPSPITFSDSFSLSSKCATMSPLKDGRNQCTQKIHKSSNAPEVICCNSSSSEEELSKRILALKTDYKSPSKETTIPFQDLKDKCTSSDKELNMSPEKLEPPDSPWVFRVYKPSKNFKESTCSASTDIPSKKEVKNSTSSIQKQSKSMCPSTPSTAALKFQISNSPITPFPDYKSMKTPEIKEALKKVGIKALPRKKAVAVLSHIYDETHPWNGTEEGADKDADLISNDKASTEKVLNVPKKRKQPTEKNTKAIKKKQKTNIPQCGVEDEGVFDEKNKKKQGSSHPPKSSSSSQDSKHVVDNLSASPTESRNSR